MVVIFEGLDGVGKTYLSTLFSKFYDFEYIKESYTDDDKEKYNRFLKLEYRILLESNVIYDRSTCIDDFVYSFLNNKESCLENYKEEVKTTLEHCIIFHLLVDEDIRKQRFEERGDEYITNDNIKTLEDNYMKFYSHLYNEVHLFPLSGDEINDIKKIKNIIDKYGDITHC